MIFIIIEYITDILLLTQTSFQVLNQQCAWNKKIQV